MFRSKEVWVLKLERIRSVDLFKINGNDKIKIDNIKNIMLGILSFKKLFLKFINRKDPRIIMIYKYAALSPESIIVINEIISVMKNIILKNLLRLPKFIKYKKIITGKILDIKLPITHSSPNNPAILPGKALLLKIFDPFIYS